MNMGHAPLSYNGIIQKPPVTACHTVPDGSGSTMAGLPSHGSDGIG